MCLKFGVPVRLGGRNFCPPSLSAAAEFRISLCEMRRQEKRCCACPTHPCAHNKRNSLVKIREKIYSNNKIVIQGFIILLYHSSIIIQVWHKRIKSARI